MPGYKSLPGQFRGAAAEHVRFAEVLQRAGDPEDAAHVLEATLEVCAGTAPELPVWLCGRLAALYRSLRRYDDEVRLLERYRESQLSEDARTRFDARLSKARAIADRHRKTDTRALSSVRCVMRGREDGEMPSRSIEPREEESFSAGTVAAVRAALAAAALKDADADRLPLALARMCAEGRRRGYPAERMVIALKQAWRSTHRPTIVGLTEWEAVYRGALAVSLELYFATGAG